MRIRTFLIWIVLSGSYLSASLSEFIHEGSWVMTEDPTLKNIAEKIITPLLPYNPTIIEIGKDFGDMTKILMRVYPQGHFVVFISDKNKLIKLQSEMRDFSFVSSYRFARTIDTSLDELCEKKAIKRADLIRWDTKDLEWSFIKLSSEILRTASVLSIKTANNGKKGKNFKFITLQKSLDGLGFCLLSHSYKEGGEGESIFIKKEIYDEIFR